MLAICRRRFVIQATGAMLAAEGWGASTPRAGAQDPDGVCTLGFSTYGMKDWSTEDALRTIASIGFDAVEITVRQGWDADSTAIGPARRARLRNLLRDTGLRLVSLMEHVFPQRHQTATLDRLRRAAELAHALAPDKPPLIQTVMGSGVFGAQKAMLRDALGAWAEIGRRTETTIAIKPHRGGVVSQPAEAIWLLEQVGEKNRLGMVYDYSHYAFRGLGLVETIEQALPYTVHVAVKDPVRTRGGVEFRLPGSAGTIDYSQLLRTFFAGGYRGDFNCEVSGMVWSQPDYDPSAAARQCYAAMNQFFTEAGVPRPAPI